METRIAIFHESQEGRWEMPERPNVDSFDGACYPSLSAKLRSLRRAIRSHRSRSTVMHGILLGTRQRRSVVRNLQFIQGF
jgi:hypothetical protein